MEAERVLLETDAQGNLIGLPKLPPNMRLEAIFLLLEDKMPERTRRPPAGLKGTVTTPTPDNAFEPTMSDEEWEISLDRSARQIAGDPEAFK